MPKKWFIYPDGIREEIAFVLSGKSQIAPLYAPITYYMQIGEDREWKGHASVTGCLNGTRFVWLKYHVDYTVDVDASCWLVLGTGVHSALEAKKDTDKYKAENFVKYLGIWGRYDLVEKEADGIWTLSDTKTSGSYYVQKALGIREKGRKPITEADGNPLYYVRNGKHGKVGDPKTEPAYVMNLLQGDIFNEKMQTNFYRLALNNSGMKIERLKIFYIIKDGGLACAKGRGLARRTYYIEIPIEDKAIVEKFFISQSDKLIMHMKESAELRAKNLPVEKFISEAKSLEVIPEICNARECWDGMRCKMYCEVKEACSMIGDNKYLKRNGTDFEFKNF